MSSEDKGPTMRKQTTEKSDGEKEVGVTSSALPLELSGSSILVIYSFKARVATDAFGEVVCHINCRTVSLAIYGGRSAQPRLVFILDDHPLD